MLQTGTSTVSHTISTGGAGGAVVVGGGIEFLNLAASSAPMRADVTDTTLNLYNFGDAPYAVVGARTITFTFVGASAPITSISVVANGAITNFETADVTFTANTIVFDVSDWNVPLVIGRGVTVTVNPVVAAVVETPPAAPPPPPNYYPALHTNFDYILRYYTFGRVPALADTVTTPTGVTMPNPLIANEALVRGLANQVNAGTLSYQKALDQFVDLADGTTSVAVMTYGFFTNRIPTRDGLDYLVSSPLNDRDLNDGYYAGVSLENRYINFAVNLGKVGDGRAAFQTGYGSLSLTDATAKAYAEIFGTTPSAQKIADILTPTRVSYLTSMGGDDLGAKAAMVGFLLGEAAKSDTGRYSVMTENFLYDLADGIAAYGSPLTDYWNAGPRYNGLVGEVVG